MTCCRHGYCGNGPLSSAEDVIAAHPYTIAWHHPRAYLAIGTSVSWHNVLWGKANTRGEISVCPLFYLSRMIDHRAHCAPVLSSAADHQDDPTPTILSVERNTMITDDCRSVQLGGEMRQGLFDKLLSDKARAEADQLYRALFRSSRWTFLLQLCSTPSQDEPPIHDSVPSHFGGGQEAQHPFRPDRRPGQVCWRIGIHAQATGNWFTQHFINI